jgi:endonuclease YncB( thermonuclease family)
MAIKNEKLDLKSMDIVEEKRGQLSKRIAVMWSALIVICLFVFSGCQKESVKTASEIIEKRWRVTAVKVEDNGIVLVTSGGQLDKVKLMDVYFPDTFDSQHGNAKKYLEGRVLGKTLELKPVTVDGSITICEIYVESLCINKDILEEGLAWYFPKHGNYEEWLGAFQKAQLDKKGIWSTSGDQIKLPLELNREIAAKENLKERYSMVVLPFVIYHNPYKASYGSSRGAAQRQQVIRTAPSDYSDYLRKLAEVQEKLEKSREAAAQEEDREWKRRHGYRWP